MYMYASSVTAKTWMVCCIPHFLVFTDFMHSLMFCCFKRIISSINKHDHITLLKKIHYQTNTLQTQLVGTACRLLKP